MKVLFTKEISNHPTIEGVTRKVEGVLGYMDSYSEKLDIKFLIHNYKDGVLLYTKDLTDIIDNSRTMLVRDENLEPIENPNYDAETMEESEMYLNAPAFNYFIEQIFTLLDPLVSKHINEMDLIDNKFNI